MYVHWIPLLNTLSHINVFFFTAIHDRHVLSGVTLPVAKIAICYKNLDGYTDNRGTWLMACCLENGVKFGYK